MSRATSGPFFLTSNSVTFLPYAALLRHFRRTSLPSHIPLSIAQRMSHTREMARHLIPQFVQLAFEKIQPFEKCPLCGHGFDCSLIHDCCMIRMASPVDQSIHFMCRHEKIEIIQYFVEKDLITSSCRIRRNQHLYVVLIDFEKQRTTIKKAKHYEDLGYEFSVTGCRPKFFLCESLDELCDSYDKFFNFA